MPALASARQASPYTLILLMQSAGWGKSVIESRYGNLFQMYEKIVDENPYETPMMIYPAVHYTMGGTWVDYELQSTIPGLFVTGEATSPITVPTGWALRPSCRA